MTRQDAWTVGLYTDAPGKSPPLEFINSLPKREQAKITRVLELLREFGPALGFPHARPIRGLWELRAGTGRLFYFVHAGRRFIILHGYRKQRRKVSRKEIEMAHRRKAILLKSEQ